MTVREEELLKFIIQFKQVNGFSPTVREIATGINTKSTDHVRNMIQALEDKGYLTYKEKSPRTIVVKRFI